MVESTEAAPSLGDCILHLTHHEMTSDCWEAAIEHYMTFTEECLARPEFPDEDAVRAEGRDRYKAAYERALLDATRSEVADA